MTVEDPRLTISLGPGTSPAMSGETHCLSTVMPGFMPGIHVFTEQPKSKDVDGRDKQKKKKKPAMSGETHCLSTVMPGFMPGIHVLLRKLKKEVLPRDERGHDG